MTGPPSRQRGGPISTNPQSSRLTVMKIWSKAPDGCFIPRQTGRLIVGRNMTLTLTEAVEKRIGTSAVQFRAVNCDDS
jgi:hypothetical protein